MERPEGDSELAMRGRRAWFDLGNGWPVSLALGAISLVVYLANGHDIGTDDTVPATLIPHALARGDGVVLDHFAPVLVYGGDEVIGCATRRRGHLVSRHPVATGVLALPLVWPQRLIYDWTTPGWRSYAGFEWRHGIDMAKRAAAIMAAAVVVVMHRVFRQVGFRRESMVASLALALGSPLWVIGSQALWQHGPLALGVAVLMWCLAVENPGRARFAFAGVVAGAMLAVRPLALPFVVLAMGWTLRFHARRLVWFLPGLLTVAGATALHNFYWFGTLAGGQAELESVHERVHAVEGMWNSNFAEGLLGTLFSPARGLFVYAPWVGLSLVWLPWTWSRFRTMPFVPWMLWGLIPFGAVLSLYAVWWGGFCYGPRYWTDVGPLLALLLAAALAETRGRSAIWRVIFVLLIAWSIGLQAIGAFFYPSSWNLSPKNVDLHHERLWDWADNEVTRCLNEKVFKTR